MKLAPLAHASTAQTGDLFEQTASTVCFLAACFAWRKMTRRGAVAEVVTGSILSDCKRVAQAAETRDGAPRVVGVACGRADYGAAAGETKRHRPNDLIELSDSVDGWQLRTIRRRSRVSAPSIELRVYGLLV